MEINRSELIFAGESILMTLGKMVRSFRDLKE